MTVTIALHPLLNGRFEAKLGDVTLVKSRIPFLDGARELLRLGFDPATPYEARHFDSPIVALRSTIGEAARLTVSDPDRGRLRLGEYVPREHPSFVSLDT